MTTGTLVPADELAKLAKNTFLGESDGYRNARRALLAQKIEFRRHMTRLAAQRPALPPGPIIGKNYLFHENCRRRLRQRLGPA